MSDNNINLYVSSKNRLDGTASSFTVNLPNGLLTNEEYEEWVLSVNGFYLINSWYNIQKSYNNQFQLLVNNVAVSLELNEGSPNIYELYDDVVLKTNSYLNIVYNRITNKFTYYNISGTTLSIIPLNCGGFLGFENLTVNDIDVDGTECELPINVQGDMMLFLRLYGGDITLQNDSIDNFNDGLYETCDIIFSIPINVPSGALISYNGGDNNFKHKLSQSRNDIDKFHLIIVNERGQQITGMTDYYLLLQFQKNVNYYIVILKYLEDIKTIFKNIYEFIKWFSETYYNQIIP
jgi:hypothetical protein